jgi:hypothetical protein
MAVVEDLEGALVAAADEGHKALVGECGEEPPRAGKGKGVRTGERLRLHPSSIGTPGDSSNSCACMLNR